MRQVKSVALWTHKLAMRSLLLAGATTLLAALVLVPKVDAQVTISVNPPICSYGYYNYSPYACAPSGYYGPGYFFNGIFLGMGPWANWGYSHGWGGHRFSGGGGGRYVGSRGYSGGQRSSAVRASGSRRNAPAGGSHAAAARGNTSHAAAARGNTSHATAARGGESRGGGESHGGERAGR
jgi:hypothetical protein